MPRFTQEHMIGPRGSLDLKRLPEFAKVLASCIQEAWATTLDHDRGFEFFKPEQALSSIVDSSQENDSGAEDDMHVPAILTCKR